MADALSYHLGNKIGKCDRLQESFMRSPSSCTSARFTASPSQNFIPAITEECKTGLCAV
ncbi:hypothetical protein [Microcoleus sp. FACHB-831]|uniref:hypothetical protein n=1 Tax=Microcoleus sp. FACHB-831 TaxID=2692827 RepID=UPI001682297C|nr:hypothetical protein [Microcoleus sp. FACHB-831]